MSRLVSIKQPSVCLMFIAICAVMTLMVMQAKVSAQPFTQILTGPIAADRHNTAGVSWIDYDDDGDLDLFASNFRQANVLYRNDNDTFVKVIDSALVSYNTPSLGQSWADYDNDGDLDVCVAGNSSRLFRNEGGEFTQLTGAEVSRNQGFSCAWGDYDGDGHIDLIIVSSAFFFGAPPQTNTVLHNNGDGTFSKTTNEPFAQGLSSFTIPTWSDFDLDGDLDLSIGSGPVTTERGLDHFYRNLLSETGTLEFERIQDGSLYKEPRDGQTINWVDYDNDGDFDVFITNYGRNNNKLTDDLYRNDNGNYIKVTNSPIAQFRAVSMAQIWGDFDNDADQDLIVVGCDNNTNRYFLNNGDGTFAYSADSAFSTGISCSWGGSAGDYDDDGDLDVVIANLGQFSGAGEPNQFYRNDLNNNNHWLKIDLMGMQSNRAAIGAKIFATAIVGERQVTQLREISSQNTFAGHNSLTAHFGFGDATNVEEVRVEWPSGAIDVLSDVSANQRLKISEGQTQLAREPSSNLSVLMLLPLMLSVILTAGYCICRCERMIELLKRIVALRAN